MKRLCLAVLFWALCLTVVGCSDGDVVHVSGDIQFNGKPVAAGRIYFNPDFAKGHDGPQGFAEIRNGKFDTRLKNGNPPRSGPTIVVINGFAGSDDPLSMGDALFADYQERLDLPKGLTTRSFNVPASAGEKLKKDPNPGKKT